MNKGLAEALAGMVVDTIVDKALRAFLDTAAQHGISKSEIPQQYLEAIETGASLGAAQTMLVLKEMDLIKSA